MTCLGILCLAPVAAAVCQVMVWMVESLRSDD
jgi:hypothetical protein